jgi:hypothetical protein
MTPDCCSKDDCVLRRAVRNLFYVWESTDDDGDGKRAARRLLYAWGSTDDDGKIIIQLAENFSYNVKVWKDDILLGEYNSEPCQLILYFSVLSEKDIPQHTSYVGNILSYMLRKDRTTLEEHGIWLEKANGM